jgi:hypothetical protein
MEAGGGGERQWLTRRSGRDSAGSIGWHRAALGVEEDSAVATGIRQHRQVGWQVVSSGVRPTDIGSPEAALEVEEEAQENLAACRRPSQNPPVRI